jgi:pyruvate/2-oxoglutarate dehydrogenase complex dihydrolipoamide acyltransferase (E2) component
MTASLFPQKNKYFKGIFEPSTWRKLSVGSWGSPHDPSLYGVVEYNAERALAYIEQQRTITGERITITHFVGKVFAAVLKHQPDLNTELKWGKFHQRASIDISFQVVIEDGGSPDLSAGIIRNIDKKSLAEIARILNQHAHSIRKEKDPEYGKLKKFSPKLPGFLLRPAIILLGFILNRLNWWTPLLGLPRNSFGSMLITNVGSLGLEFVFPALFPPASVPMIFAIGKLFDAPVYQTNSQGIVTETRLEKHIRLCGTVDHRYIDGLHAARAAKEIQKYFDQPELLEAEHPSENIKK